jgi:hypothetical protein
MWLLLLHMLTQAVNYKLARCAVVTALPAMARSSALIHHKQNARCKSMLHSHCQASLLENTRGGASYLTRSAVGGQISYCDLTTVAATAAAPQWCCDRSGDKMRQTSTPCVVVPPVLCVH